MKKQTKEFKEFLERVAVQKMWDDGFGNTMDSYYSKIDGSFIDSVASNDTLPFLFKNGITEQIQSSRPEDPKVSCIGFNPTEQKWYGWSHRAIYGFGIGSEVKKGDCGYQSTGMQDFIESSVRFWQDEAHKDVAGIEATDKDGLPGVQITYEYVPEHVPNKSLHGTIGESFMYAPAKWGKGEWVAKTMEDAKQMAIDFAQGVS